MNKQEFEAIVHLSDAGAKLPTQEEYTLIEFVYNYHPCIDNVRGKAQVSRLWREFGLAIFKDMEARASEAKDLERKLSKAKAQLDVLIDAMESLRKGR